MSTQTKVPFNGLTPEQADFIARQETAAAQPVVTEQQDQKTTMDGHLLSLLRSHSDDPKLLQAAAEIRHLRSENRRLQYRVHRLEASTAREVTELSLELDAVRSVLEAFRTSSNDAWEHVRNRSRALDEALLLAVDKDELMPGIGFMDVAEVIARSISRLYPSEQPTDLIVKWKRYGRSPRSG